MSILDYASSTGWAMLDDRAKDLVEIAERYHDAQPHVLEAYRAQALERSQRAKVRDNVAILYAEGPLFKKANLMVEYCGATSYQMLRKDLQIAADDPTIKNMVLMVDSPGGEANGCDELAAAIHEISKSKPITAYVSGMAASGGYWLAAACSKIVISDAAMLGSIGVVLGMRDTSEADAKRGVKSYEFVSSQSPGKRPHPGSKEGNDQIQTLVDDLADVFISAVAQYRGVSVEDVIAKFGGGGMKIGQKAVAAGMADSVGSAESLITSLIQRGNKVRSFPLSSGVIKMADLTAEEITASATKTATEAAQARMKGIIGVDAAKETPKLANYLAFETSLSADMALKIMETAKADFPAPVAPVAPVPPAPAASVDQQQIDYDKRKAEAGALGLGHPEPTGGDPAASAKGWNTAVGMMNGSVPGGITR